MLNIILISSWVQVLIRLLFVVVGFVLFLIVRLLIVVLTAISFVGLTTAFEIVGYPLLYNYYYEGWKYKLDLFPYFIFEFILYMVLDLVDYFIRIFRFIFIHVANFNTLRLCWVSKNMITLWILTTIARNDIWLNRLGWML